MNYSDRFVAVPSNPDQPQPNKFLYCSLPRASGQLGYFRRQHDLPAHLFVLERFKQDRAAIAAVSLCL